MREKIKQVTLFVGLASCFSSTILILNFKADNLYLLIPAIVFAILLVLLATMKVENNISSLTRLVNEDHDKLKEIAYSIKEIDTSIYGIYNNNNAVNRKLNTLVPPRYSVAMHNVTESPIYENVSSTDLTA